MAHPPLLPAASPLRGSALLARVAVPGYRQLRATEKESVPLAPLVPGRRGRPCAFEGLIVGFDQVRTFELARR